MSKALYTAEAQVTGGRNGHGRTLDGVLALELRPPKELGGDGEGTNPEQLFAIGYAACFGTTLALIAQRQNVEAADAAIESSVSLLPTDDGRFRLGVELRIALPALTDEQAVSLAESAHQLCPYSNAIRDNVAVALVVNGTHL